MELLLQQLSVHKGRMLDLLELVIEEPKYQAVRRFLLGEFGNDGLEREIKQAFSIEERDGKGRNIFAGEEVPE